ncbi:MAG TPA: hypothetical protein VK631_13065 [Solirubrobacteraceae bacterium]|nr:hypothetical protein [Solirubrobacteraceae bacterium]
MDLEPTDKVAVGAVSRHTDALEGLDRVTAVALDPRRGRVQRGRA